jgi:hypothetical protein
MSMRRLLQLSLAGVLVPLLFAACKKDVTRSEPQTPAGSFTITGTVRDANGPVVGASIHVVYRPDTLLTRLCRSVRPTEQPRLQSRAVRREALDDAFVSYVWNIIPLDHALNMNLITFAERGLSSFEVQRDGITLIRWAATNGNSCHLYPALVDSPLINGNSYTYDFLINQSDGQPWGERDTGNVPGAPSWEVPDSFRLHQNFPNPVDDSARISFELCRVSLVWLKVFDSSHRIVASLADSSLLPPFTWTLPLGLDSLPNGRYSYEIRVCNAFWSRRELLKNTTDYETLRHTAAAATSDPNGNFSLRVVAGDTIPLTDAAGWDLGSAVLNRATIVALKPGFDAADTLLDLTGEPPYMVSLRLTPGE